LHMKLHSGILAHEITHWNSCTCFLFYPSTYHPCLLKAFEPTSTQLPHLIILANSTAVMTTTILCTFPEVVFNLSIVHQLTSSLLACSSNLQD
jgi:hypothetical protein